MPTNTHYSHNESQLYVFEDNEAVIKMIIKGRSSTIRRVSRTHRAGLDQLFDRMNLEPKIQIKCVHTNKQLADILTKGSFSRDEWNHPFQQFSLIRLESRAPCQKEVRRRLRIKALRRRKRNHVLREREQRSEEISSQSLGCRVNPVNADDRKEVVRATKQLVLPDSNSGIGHPQASRQENSPQASGQLVMENQSQTESDVRKYSYSKSSRKLAASSPELKNMEYTSHQCMSKIFQCLQSATNATFSMDAYKTNVLI